MKRVLSIPLISALVTACASAPSVEPVGERAPEASESSIEIVYTLGHTHRRLWLESNSQFNKTWGRNTLDRSILKEAEIEPVRYQEFLAKISEFLTRSNRQLAQDAPACRNPFALTLKIGTEIRKLEGCRQADEGAMSRIIREGEFLLYSRK